MFGWMRTQSLIELYITVSSIGPAMHCNDLIPVRIQAVDDVSTGPGWWVLYPDYLLLSMSVRNFILQFAGVLFKRIRSHMHEAFLILHQPFWRHSQIRVHQWHVVIHKCIINPNRTHHKHPVSCIRVPNVGLPNIHSVHRTVYHYQRIHVNTILPSLPEPFPFVQW